MEHWRIASILPNLIPPCFSYGTTNQDHFDALDAFFHRCAGAVEMHHPQFRLSNSLVRPSSDAEHTPRSVINAVTNRAGVTSNA